MIFGATGIVNQALNILKLNDVVVYGILDDSPELLNTEINEITVLGTTTDDVYLKIIGKECESFIAYDDQKVKLEITEMLTDSHKNMPISLFHPQSSISPFAEVGYGSLFDASAVVGAGTKIGNHVVVHANAVIEPGATIGNFTIIGPNAVIQAGATIGEQVRIGAGAVVSAKITVGNKANVGPLSLVVATVSDRETVFGIPAKKV